MPNEFNLPPELHALESRLRNLPSGQSSTLDRDDLMFRSGWSAAMAEMTSATDRSRNRSRNRSRDLAPRWGWPVFSGTFATIAAVLAIALWLSPDSGDDSQLAMTPDVALPQLVVDSNRITSTDHMPKDSPPAASVNQPTFSNPMEQAIKPYIENIVGSKALPSSSLAMRHRLLGGIEFEEIQRPRVSSVSGRPQAAPLKANSYRNQELWEQL